MPKEIAKNTHNEANLLDTEQRLKHFNRPVTFRSMIDFVRSLFSGSPFGYGMLWYSEI